MYEWIQALGSCSGGFHGSALVCIISGIIYSPMEAFWHHLFIVYEPLMVSKKAAKNLNKSKLKTNTSTRKITLNSVTLPSFSISGDLTAEKM